MTTAAYPHQGRAIGERVKRLRTERGLNRHALAAAVGITTASLRRIERGAIAMPSLFTLQGLARALGVEPDAIAVWQDTRHPAHGAASRATPPRAVKPGRQSAPPVRPDLNALAEAVQTYDRAAQVVAGRIDSDLGLAGLDAVAVWFGSGEIRLLRDKCDWIGWLKRQDATPRREDALDEAAALPEPPEPEERPAGILPMSAF